MAKKTLLMVLVIMFMVTSMVLASSNKRNPREEHPPAAGGVLGIVWMNDINPPTFKRENVEYALSFIRRNCYHTWNVQLAQDDYVNFMAENPDLKGKTQMNRAMAFGREYGSRYTYVLFLMPWDVNVNKTTFRSNYPEYDGMELKDVSLTVSFILVDAEYAVNNGGVSSRCTNKRKPVPELVDSLFPDAIDKIFHSCRSYFNPSPAGSTIGKRTNTAPSVNW